MNQSPCDNNIQNAIDAVFSDATMTPQMQSRILREIRGEIKVKKKMSSALVIAIILITLTATALAVSLLSNKVFLKSREHGIPTSCVVAEDNLIMMTSDGLVSWVPSTEEPTVLFSAEKLMQLGISIDAQLFYDDKIKLLDSYEKKIWTYHHGEFGLELDYKNTPLDMGEKTRVTSLVCQNGKLFGRFMGINDLEEDALIYEINTNNGQIRQLPIYGVTELAAYDNGDLLALRKDTASNMDELIIIDSRKSKISKIIATQTELGLEGVGYSRNDKKVYAIRNGVLSFIDGDEWKAISQHAMPALSFFFSPIRDGYVAVSYKGVQFVPLVDEDSTTVLTIRGLRMPDDSDHEYQQLHPEISIVRQSETHYCVEEILQAIENGDQTDIFHVRMNADILKLMNKEMFESLSGSEILLKTSEQMIPAVSSAISHNRILYAIPSTISVVRWAIAKDTNMNIPITFHEFLQQYAVWNKTHTSIGGSKAFIAGKNESVAWSQYDYAEYLLKEYIMESMRLNRSIDFSATSFEQALRVLKAEEIFDTTTEVAEKIISSNVILSLRGLRDTDWETTVTDIHVPVIIEDSQAHSTAWLNVYLVNANSTNKEAAIAYLEYIVSHYSSHTNALLRPNTAEPALYSYVDEWIQNVADDQHALGIHTDAISEEEELAALIAGFMSMPDNWEVEQEALTYYRENIAPFIDLELHPLLSDQRAWHDSTFTKMVTVIQEYLEGSLTLNQCTKLLTELSGDKH